jgi:hypothetical protein
LDCARKELVLGLDELKSMACFQHSAARSWLVAAQGGRGNDRSRRARGLQKDRSIAF